jgi:hypothetical protein
VARQRRSRKEVQRDLKTVGLKRRRLPGLHALQGQAVREVQRLRALERSCPACSPVRRVVNSASVCAGLRVRNARTAGFQGERLEAS